MKSRILKLLSSLLLLLLLSCNFVTSATSIPKPTNLKYLNDYVGVVTEPYQEKILGLGRELELKTSAQATIVIINSTNGIPIENYSLELFRGWGIGQKDKNNGLLILIALNDSTWRVEVGKGLEGAVPDALSNRIMESLAKPSFIDGNYSEGLLKSYSAFCDAIAKEYNVTLDKSLHISVPNYKTSSSSRGLTIPSILIVILFLLDIIFNGGRISSSLLQIIFWSNIGRGGHGGSGRDDFGGFGGGSSNGGGSSGSW